jgi:hypothetical protein
MPVFLGDLRSRFLVTVVPLTLFRVGKLLPSLLGTKGSTKPESRGPTFLCGFAHWLIHCQLPFRMDLSITWSLDCFSP